MISDKQPPKGYDPEVKNHRTRGQTRTHEPKVSMDLAATI